jgi:hypothetical protein
LRPLERVLAEPPSMVNCASAPDGQTRAKQSPIHHAQGNLSKPFRDHRAGGDHRPVTATSSSSMKGSSSLPRSASGGGAGGQSVTGPWQFASAASSCVRRAALLNVGLLMRFECSFLMTPSLMIWSLADKTSWPGWHCLALLRLPRGTKSQAATRALIAESIRRCQRGRCMHNPLPLAHDAYTSVTRRVCRSPVAGSAPAAR